MVDVRSISITKLGECASPISKICLGRHYDHSPWIREGFLDLCLRKHPLTEDEASGLNIPEIIGISAAREKIRLHVVWSTCQQTWVDSKYGECLRYRTYQESGLLKGYSQRVFQFMPKCVVIIHGFLFPDKMVHDILDNTFGLDNLTTDLVSRPPSVCSRSPSPP